MPAKGVKDLPNQQATWLALNANEITHPRFLGHTGGGGLGAGTSIAVGAALGLREIDSRRRAVAILVIVIMPWVLPHLECATLKLPILFLIANNQSYYNDEDHQMKIARRGRPEENAPIGQRIEGPEPDLAGLARNLGLEAPEPITDLADPEAALIQS